MQYRLAILVVLMAVSLQAGAAEKADESEVLKEKVDRLVANLGAEEYSTRENAEKALKSLGAKAVPYLREAGKATKDPEAMTRIEGLIKALTTIGWKTDLDVARKTSKDSGRPILVLSTIGAPDGFS